MVKETCPVSKSHTKSKRNEDEDTMMKTVTKVGNEDSNKSWKDQRQSLSVSVCRKSAAQITKRGLDLTFLLLPHAHAHLLLAPRNQKQDIVQ